MWRKVLTGVFYQFAWNSRNAFTCFSPWWNCEMKTYWYNTHCMYVNMYMVCNLSVNYLFIHWLMDIWDVFTSSLLWMQLVWTCSIHRLFEYLFSFLLYIPGSGIEGSYGNSEFNSLRNYQTVLHSTCTILHTYQQYIRILVCPHSHHHLIFFEFFD